MIKQYGVGIVGYGGMGSYHGRSLKEQDRLRVVAVCDLKEERLAEGRTEGYAAFLELEELLAHPEVDVVLIATPNHVHKDIAIQAMEAGKHVICEKPVTLNADEMREIIVATERTGRTFMVHQNRRWDNDYLTVKNMVDEQLLGEVYSVESRIHGSRGIPGDWRHEKQYGGGMMLDWGVHLIDRIVMMYNEKVAKLYCEFSYVWKDECDDGFKLLLTFESGRTAQIEVGTMNYQSLPLWYALGTEGTATIRDWNLDGEMMRLQTFEDKDAKPIVAGAGFTKTMAPRGEDTIEKLPLQIVKGNVMEFYANFADTIEGKATQVIRNDEVLYVMEIIDAAFRSAETGQVVTL